MARGSPGFPTTAGKRGPERMAKSGEKSAIASSDKRCPVADREQRDNRGQGGTPFEIIRATNLMEIRGPILTLKVKL